MLRKIVLGTLFIGLIGILVAGASIRTMDRTALMAQAQGPGHGRGNGEAGTYATGGSGRGFVVSAQPNGRGGYVQGGNSGGYGGQGQWRNG